MDRIKRISGELLERYPEKFGTDFNENKKILKEVSITRSKILRNRIAGYITSNLRRQAVQKDASIMPEDETSTSDSSSNSTE